MSGPQWSANCGESLPPGYLVVSGQCYIEYSIEHMFNMLVCAYIHALGPAAIGAVHLAVRKEFPTH